MTRSVDKLVSADELLAIGDISPCELIDGRIVRLHYCSAMHGIVTAEMARLLGGHVDRQLGMVLMATGFQIRHRPDTVRSADIAFVSLERLSRGLPTDGYFPGPPDFAVEVISPDDRASEAIDKAHDWLSAGTRLVWIVDLETRSVTAYSPEGIAMIGETGTVDADPVVRGFGVTVADIFRSL